MAVDSFAVFLSGHETSLSPALIERELSSMWKPIQDAAESENTAVSRVVLGNVLWIGTSDQMERIRGVIQKVVPKYPCRLFLLEYQPANDEGNVRAAVNAQCFVPRKGEPPVCCEVIHMTFGSQSARHLQGCVAPLLLADLQTVLWEGLGDTDVRQLAELEEYADRTIHQVSLSSKPGAALRRVLASPRPCFDLSWFRMTPIREQVTAFFDDPASVLDLRKINSVRVNALNRGDASSLPEVMGALAVGWLASRLKWEAVGATDDGYQYKSPAGIIDAVIDTKAPPPEMVLNNLNTILITDENGGAFELSLGDQKKGGVMDFRCGRGDQMSSMRHLLLSELGEAEALGLALNSPMNVRYFREAAALAAPLLDQFGS